MSSYYESEITLFLKNYKKINPNIEFDQKNGRSRLWDKKQNLEILQGFYYSDIPQKSYVYQED